MFLKVVRKSFVCCSPFCTDFEGMLIWGAAREINVKECRYGIDRKNAQRGTDAVIPAN